MNRFRLGALFSRSSVVDFAQSQFGIDPNKPGLRLNPYSGIGLSPEQAANYKQLYKSHSSEREAAGRR